MANLTYQFNDFNTKIKLSEDDRKKLIKARNSLRKRMRDNYKNQPSDVRNNLEMLFQSQGSFIMDTIITPIRDDFDLDDGVYFMSQNALNDDAKPQQFHDWVIESIDKHSEYEKIKDKPTCVRVSYVLGFHIDLPIYFFLINDNSYLADTKRSWTLSNPVEFIEWFEKMTNSGFKKEFLYEYNSHVESYQQWLSDIRKNDCQLRRIVRYLKAWGNNMEPSEMPCGLIMTILAANNYVPHHRDDISLKETLQNINRTLHADCRCPRPTTPAGEDLFRDYSNKQFFLNALNNFSRDAELALREPNFMKSSEYWRRHLGSRFLLGRNENDLALATNQFTGIINPALKPHCNGR